MLLPIIAALQSPAFVFTVSPEKGLLLESKGIPIIDGSSIQIYKPDWSKGYYSSTENSKTIVSVDSSTKKMTFTSDDRLAQGEITYHVVKDHLQVHYDLLWNGDEPANAEIAAGLLWAPVFESGSILADGKAIRSPQATTYPNSEIEPRKFGPDATDYSFTFPVGALTEHSSAPLTLFDGRGSNQDWAKQRSLLWFGNLALKLEKGKHTTLDVDFQATVSPSETGQSVQAQAAVTPNSHAFSPDESIPPLIPKPQTAHLDWQHPLVFNNSFAYPAGIFEHADLFKTALARRFVLPPPTPGAKPILFDGGISKLGFVPGGYRVTVTDHSLTVLGEEDDGLRNGLERLASLAFLSHGKICFPTGTILDQPYSDWRGVHLFVGPESEEFQAKLWKKVLRPLGFNKVVLQCERTHWDSLPGIDTKETMSKEGLVRLFAMYRRMGVDPIPLIQSYGHMEWLFANGQNLDVAADHDQPYAIDPDMPRTKTLLQKLWNEVFLTLHPDTIHFGLDEVNMRGKPLDAITKTRLWGEQLGLLEGIARDHRSPMMLWGDQALAQGEAPDATLAETPKDAADRRNAIPRGSLIGDWHYLGNQDSTVYRKNLDIWRDAGMRPIASTWYDPANIAGFDREAGLLGWGYLQTTWCGYDSSEAGMMAAYDQFTAMILAADYGWSARKESPDKLGYDPAAVFTKMYFGEPSPLVPSSGNDLTLPGIAAEPFTIGQVVFGKPGHVVIPSNLHLSATSSSGIVLNTNLKARKVAFAFNTVVPAPQDGLPVAELAVTHQDGKATYVKFLYGRNIRSATDPLATPMATRDAHGTCMVTLDTSEDKTPITGIAIKMLNRFNGFVLKGVESID